MALAEDLELSEPLHWPDGGNTRVPYRVFTDPEVYRLEHERIFRGPVWHFLALEIDVAKPGDWRTGFVGEIPVVTTRDRDGRLHAFVNRCAHKGALVCLKARGNSATLTCVYHAWSYDLAGRLKGVAFRNGIKGKGGMPADFDPDTLRLEPLKVATFCGLVFGTFSDATPPIEAFIGDKMGAFIQRNLGRPLKLLGHHSQVIRSNWKLYAENVRDSYHATLLHTFYTSFRVNRLDMDGGMVLSDDGRHSISYARRDKLDEAAEYKEAEVHAAQFGSDLEGPALLGAWNEFEDGITHSIQTIFPTLAIQFTLNSLAVRHFVPRGIDKTELIWMYVGYENDTPEQTRMRTLQGNLTGPAGLVSLEDGCINEFVQRGVAGSADATSFIEMGGRDVGSSEGSRATETSIRGFWQGYRDLMGWA